MIPLSTVFSICSTYTYFSIKFEKGGETFWLSSRTFAHVVESQDGSEIFTYDINVDNISSFNSSHQIPTSHTSPVNIVKIPSTTAANFRFNPITSTLVFSSYVYPDGNLSSVADQDKEWEERGNTALVYDATYVRHWDVWQGKKGPQLFGVRIQKESGGAWKVDKEFASPLMGTKHVRIFSSFLLFRISKQVF